LANRVFGNGGKVSLATDGKILWVGTEGSQTSIYRVNLATGHATEVGPLAAPLTAFALLPDSSVALPATATVGEAAGSVTLAVTRTGSTTMTSNVGWRVEGGSATPGSDYTAASGTVTFAPGETSKQVVVPITADAQLEGSESFTVRRVDPQGASSLGNAATTVTIADDDPDRVAPIVLLTSRDPFTAKLLRRRGITSTWSCDEACSATITLRLGRKVVGTSTVALSKAGVWSARTKLSRRGRTRVDAALAKRPSIALVVRGTFRDAAGNSAVRNVTVHVTR
jgi:hypothetical protein